MKRSSLAVSIIIPVRNEKKNLLQLLPYLRRNCNEQPEIIVVDSFDSADNVESLCIDNDTKYLRSKSASRAKQMNEGATIATTDFLVFLHADVRPPGQFDIYIRNVINQGNQMGFFAYKFDPSTKWLDKNASYTFGDGLFAGGGDQIHFMTKVCYQKLGGYNEMYVIMEDFDFIRRIRKNEIPYCIVQQQAIVSSRKYEKNSYLKVNLVNLVAFVAFVVRVKPTTIKRFYKFALVH